MYVLDRRRLLKSAAALAAFAALQAAGLANAFAADQGTLTLYNGQHRTTTAALVDAFTKATGIQVTIRNGESPELASQIVEEGAASPADLFYSEQSPPIAALAEKGLLAPIDPETLKQIPADFAARDGTWIGGSIRCRVVAFNKTLASPDSLPKTIYDFATPAMDGKFAYVAKDGFQEQIMAIERLKGRDAALAWVRGVKRYGRSYNSNSAAMKAVEAGEIQAALTNNYYWYAVAKEVGADKMNAALHHLAKGDAGALTTLSAAGILKTSRNAALAQRFLAFMVSEAGQTAIVGSVAEYPVRAGIASPYHLPPLDQYGPNSVTAADIGSAADAYVLERQAGMI
jgi:iron(III) transport system substrate-binding protein